MRRFARGPPTLAGGRMCARLNHSALAGGQGILYVERGVVAGSSDAQEDEGADVGSRSIGNVACGR